MQTDLFTLGFVVAWMIIRRVCKIGRTVLHSERTVVILRRSFAVGKPITGRRFALLMPDHARSCAFP